MHTLTVKIQDEVFDKIFYLLNSLPKNEVEIVEVEISDESETIAFSNHSANLIEEWKDSKEDEIWK